MTASGARSQLRKQYSTLVECMDPDFGLLDQLLATGVLNQRHMEDINAENTASRRNEMLISVLMRRDDRLIGQFLQSLDNTGQTHIARCLREESSDDDDSQGDRPLSHGQLEVLRRNQPRVKDLLVAEDFLLSSLEAADCITSKHREYITLPTRSGYQRNGELLDIMRRRSVAANQTFVEILRDHGQETVASLLDLRNEATIEKDGQQETETDGISTATAGSVETEQQQISNHADVLRSLYTKLTATVDACTVAVVMFEHRSLTMDDLQSILAKRKKPAKAAEKLINIVTNHSRDVYDSFLRGLTESDQQHVRHIIAEGSAEGLDNRFDHSEIIRQNYRFLLDVLDTQCSGLVEHLYADYVLTREEMESIRCEGTSYRRNEHLLSVLSRKTMHQFGRFLDALESTEQNYIRNHILTGRKWSQGCCAEENVNSDTVDEEISANGQPSGTGQQQISRARAEEKIPTATEETPPQDIKTSVEYLTQQLAFANDTIAMLMERLNETQQSEDRHVAAASSLPPGFELRHTPDGRVYYVDHNTRTTSWNPPASSATGTLTGDEGEVNEVVDDADFVTD